MKSQDTYTTGAALLEALAEAGVAYIFANFGSDHPALIEAIAEARAVGRPIPNVITCPNEMVALSCAHGYAQITGAAQAVVVHVECGTQSLAGAVHNAARGRVPVFIFAGLSPFTQDGELRGSRNEFIQWIQDVHDQRGIVRGYMKYETEVRTGRNIKQIVRRALQFAHSEPKGPVYLACAREVMEDKVSRVEIDAAQWQPLRPSALTEPDVAGIVDDLAKAKAPLVVTTYLGRNPAAVAELTRLCRRLGIGVVESVPTRMNFPHDDALYCGGQWNHPVQNEALAEADVVLVIDSDVPWIPTLSRPPHDARIHHIDADPLKQAMPLWYIGAQSAFQADAATALAQLSAYLDHHPPDAARVDERRARFVARHAKRQAKLAHDERMPDGIITPEFLTACVRRQIDDETIVINEGITNYHVICDHLGRTRPGSIYASGGGSLGWNGGAAIGAKLAAPERTIAALTGDGSYMFSQPSTVHWMARHYATPFLQVIYNNRGWKAPKFSALAVHPDGHASRANRLDLDFDPPPDYAAIAAAAGGAYARKVDAPGDVEGAIAEALRVVREERRAAVLDVWLAHL